jgi:hypothetical protein
MDAIIGAVMLEDFLDLSRVLTGDEALSVDLAKKFIERVGAEPSGKYLPDLVEVWRRIRSAGGDIEGDVQKQIMSDANLGPLAKLIVFLWYTGGIPNAAGTDWRFGEADEYFSALVWSAIKAHPPALSRGYFGHWKYPPEN